MRLERVLQFAKSLLEKSVTAGDITVDCTVGNGHDTVFLAQLVGDSGKVIGFDVQTMAIQNTSTRLQSHNLQNRVTLYNVGHEYLIEKIDNSYEGKITGAIFNLGYLPGSDKKIVTKPKTTIAAIEQLLKIMAPGGMIVIVVYHGHKAGAVERDYLLSYVTQLDQKVAHVLKYQFINQKNNPPFIIAIEKRIS